MTRDERDKVLGRLHIIISLREPKLTDLEKEALAWKYLEDIHKVTITDNAWFDLETLLDDYGDKVKSGYYGPRKPKKARS